MTDVAHNPDDYCYRHPDRLSFVLCEKCGRTICLECQNHVGGQVLCPDDARKSNVIMMPVNQRPPRPKRVRTRTRLLNRIPDGWPIVTYAILAVLVVVFLADTISRGAIGPYAVVTPGGPLSQPWTLITAMFYPGSILGLLLGGVNLFFLGRILEPRFGRTWFFVLYVVGGFGAATIAFLLDGLVYGIFGAIAGLIGALVVMARRMGANLTYLYISCAVSAVLSILLGGWQAFLGGFVTGAVVGFILLMEDNTHRTRRAVLQLTIVLIVLIVVAFGRALIFQFAS